VLARLQLGLLRARHPKLPIFPMHGRKAALPSRVGRIKGRRRSVTRRRRKAEIALCWSIADMDDGTAGVRCDPFPLLYDTIWPFMSFGRYPRCLVPLQLYRITCIPLILAFLVCHTILGSVSGQYCTMHTHLSRSSPKLMTRYCLSKPNPSDRVTSRVEVRVVVTSRKYHRFLLPHRTN